MITVEKPTIVQKLEVSRDLSGGVKIKMGDRACVLSPQQAVDFASGVLRSAGVTVEFTSLFKDVGKLAS